MFHESSLKVIIMLMGELDYSGFRHRTELLTMGMEYVAIGVFIVFCVTVSLVVNNLLVSELSTTIWSHMCLHCLLCDRISGRK